MNDDIYYENDTPKGKIVLSKKVIVIIVLIVTVLCVLLYFLFHDSDNETASMKLKGTDVLYIGEPTNILIDLKGNAELLKAATTSFYAADDDVVYINSYEFYGKSGSMTLVPIETGEDNVYIYTTVGAESTTKTIADKVIHVTVCPKFTENLLSEKEIVLSKGETQDININFDNSKCLKRVSYTSLDEDIIDVDALGSITAHEVGNTNVVISNGVNSITLAVKVID